MDFSANKPIYMQICDSICERILSGEILPGERIPSVREMGAALGVNPNTVMRSYEKLTSDGIVYNKRGIGYFISDDAVYTTLGKMRKDFMEEELPQILRRIKLLRLDPAEILAREPGGREDNAENPPQEISVIG